MKFNFLDNSGISTRDIEKTKKKVLPYLRKMREAAADSSYSRPEASLHLPFDKDLPKQIKKIATERGGSKIKEVLLVGIGGSSLGSRAVYEAIRPKGAKLSFYETVYSRILEEGIARIKKAREQEILINIISKSGATVETIALTRVLLEQARRRFKNWQSRVVVTSEPESKLSAWAGKQGIAVLSNPPLVGGRYSVFSAVGLFPLELAGVNIDKLIAGARNALAYSLASDVAKNYAWQSAAAIFRNWQKGKVIHDTFFFDPDCEALGKWYRQLLAESLGKTPAFGPTPTVSVGSTDLHSVGQLYLAGPKNKFTTFVKVASAESLKVPGKDGLEGLVPNISGKKIAAIMSAIYSGAIVAYRKRKIPFIEIEFSSLTESEIGEFLQMKMVEVMLLGRLAGVNAFDQPNVEEYKKITGQLLVK